MPDLLKAQFSANQACEHQIIYEHTIQQRGATAEFKLLNFFLDRDFRSLIWL